jgi:glucokinase
MNNKAFIGVDIGGTGITAGLIEDGKIVNKEQVDTLPQRSANEILESLYAVINKVLTKNVVGIGLGVPGYLDVKQGKIILINNIPAFSGLNIADKVSEKFNLPVKINNDANCFVLGESLFGPGANYETVVGLTCGTGLGGGIVINGKVLSGVYGGAGELGLLPYCDTIFEDYCSGKFFENNYNKSGKELYELACNGNDKAVEAFNKFGMHLGHLIRQVMYFAAPEAIIIGGSIANSFDMFKPYLDSYLAEMPEKHLPVNTKIIRAELSDAALFGAASLVM